MGKLGVEAGKARINVDDLFMSQKPPGAMDKIVQLNTVSGTKSLAKAEWLSTDAAMPMEEKQTHLNLRKWMQENAASRGIKDTEEEEEEDDDDVMGMLAGADLPSGEDEADEPSEAAPAAKSEAKKGKKDEKKEEKKEEKQERNWSAVNLAH